MTLSNIHYLIQLLGQHAGYRSWACWRVNGLFKHSGNDSRYRWEYNNWYVADMLGRPVRTIFLNSYFSSDRGENILITVSAPGSILSATGSWTAVFSVTAGL